MTVYFSRETLGFLKDLKRHNDRDWFKKNKDRYDQYVKTPSLDFINDVGVDLRKISQFISADPRPVGGSLFRIHRDVRFSKDKSPYKTHLGIHFRHSSAKDVHAPGYYLHVEPGGSFMAGGVWLPESKSLRSIRDAIADASQWKKIRPLLSFTDERLTRPPQGFQSTHPFIEDIKLKSFLGSNRFADGDLLRGDFRATFVDSCRSITPLMKFLAHALNVAW